MSDFNFIGALPASKSLMNRALIVKSFFPELTILGESLSDDVMLMSKACEHLLGNQPFDCGHAGTVLRFLALRLSRIPGEHKLIGSSRLFSRPQEELIIVLRQLGCDVALGKNELLIHSNGWQLSGDGLHVNTHRSSQFLSAIFLNSWRLERPLHIAVEGRVVSESYLKMTIQLLLSLGMNIEKVDRDYIVMPSKQLAKSELMIEPDMSSAFAVASVAVISGQACIRGQFKNSLQPEAHFYPILQKMGVKLLLEMTYLKFRKLQI